MSFDIGRWPSPAVFCQCNTTFIRQCSTLSLAVAVLLTAQTKSKTMSTSMTVILAFLVPSFEAVKQGGQLNSEFSRRLSHSLKDQEVAQANNSRQPNLCVRGSSPRHVTSADSAFPTNLKLSPFHKNHVDNLSLAFINLVLRCNGQSSTELRRLEADGNRVEREDRLDVSTRLDGSFTQDGSRKCHTKS
jgi:hypothetical protein